MSGATKLTHVHTPIKIGPVTIKNRVVRTAHQTRLPDNGNISERLIAYHEARAKGGVGLTIIETMGVHPTSPGTIYGFHPDLPNSYPRMIDRLKKYDMTTFQQLWHAGHNTHPLDGSPGWSVSDRHSYVYPIVPIAMTKSMIDEVVESYANTAYNCEQWGADGVEVHASHGYLPAQFLSPALNDREDEYGGSLENRARFLLEVLEAVRARVSNRFAMAVRLGAEDLQGLVESNELHQVAQWIEERGLTDVFNISMGNYQRLGKVIAGMHEPLGYQMPTSLPVRENLKTPVILIGRVRTLEEADQWIRSGDCDMVALNRATIADPDLVNKTLAGHPEQVRPCIACNQACVGGEFIADIGTIGCAVNPGACRELFLGDGMFKPVETPRKVVVVGGGPAGMEAARVAASRGHKVTLVEAQPRLGGTINLAAMAPTRAGIRDITVWQEDEIFRLGVEVQLSTYVDADDIAAMEPDSVILATGAMPRMDGIQVSNPGQPVIGIEQQHVISSNGLFEGERRELGQSAVVIDDVGHYEGIATADYLVSKGLKVTLVTQQPMFGIRTEKFLINDAALQRLHRGDFHYHTRTRAVEITKDSVIIAPVYGPDNSNTIHTLSADTVVFISLNKPNREMYAELQARGIEVRLAGDAEDPRFLAYATLRGHKAGAAV